MLLKLRRYANVSSKLAVTLHSLLFSFDCDITDLHTELELRNVYFFPPPLSLSLSLSLSQYYQDANEADVWMNDKAGTAANQDYGRDEDAAVKALKKHKVG